MNLFSIIFISFIILSNSYFFRLKYPIKKNFTEVFSNFNSSNSLTFLDSRNQILNKCDEIVTNIHLFMYFLNI